MTEKRAARDEGAALTKQIIEAVKGFRRAKGWSAQQLADAMTEVGVPWNVDVVVNLEHGRRKSLRVHEFLALAWVLGVPNPVDLIAPDNHRHVQLLPNRFESNTAVRAWFAGDNAILKPQAPQAEAYARALQWLTEMPDIGMTQENADRLKAEVLEKYRKLDAQLPESTEDGDDGQG